MSFYIAPYDEIVGELAEDFTPEQIIDDCFNEEGEQTEFFIDALACMAENRQFEKLINTLSLLKRKNPALYTKLNVEKGE